MFISTKAQPTDSISKLISKKRIASLLTILSNVFLFLICVTIFKSALVEAFYVPSRSMSPTLDVSDYIVVAKFPYGLHIPLQEEPIVQWSKPVRGEVVVFTRKEEPSTHFVKRVIGVEGDSVEIIGSQLVVNGLIVAEPYAVWGHSVLGNGKYHFGPVTVPKNSIFVLGDNRGESRDSRFWEDPFVNLKNIVGKACLIYWSTEKLSRVGSAL